MPPRRNSNLHGLLIVDKPPGPTSAEVVRLVRAAAGGAKTGHAGTLDPRASGLLVCVLGRATKTVESLMALTKTYEARVDLSAFTATDDAEGPREEVVVERPPTREQIEEVLLGLTGVVRQTPPAYSAVKVQGRPAYWYARRGRPVRLEPRPVRIDKLTVEEYEWPRLALTVVCGRGTYVRALARQFGERLGTGGHLTALRRTAVGPYTTARAVRLRDLPCPLRVEHLLPPPEKRTLGHAIRPTRFGD